VHHLSVAGDRAFFSLEYINPCTIVDHAALEGRLPGNDRIPSRCVSVTDRKQPAR
jgi:hypothetical protein